MVDGINFNPLTGKVFSAEEILKLDANGDKKVSYDELQANMSWLSAVGGNDEEGNVDIGDKTKPAVPGTTSNKTYEAAKKNGVKDNAADSTELKEYMNKVQDAYIEQYMQSNPNMSSSDKSSLIAFIKSTGAEFLNQYVEKNTKTPYDTKAVAAELMAKLDSTIAEKKQAMTAVNKEIENLKGDGDEKFNNLSEYANKADNDYVTSSEFNEMKKQAIAYLMNQLLNGNEDSDFLSGINANYKNDTNYKVATLAIKSLETEKDPAKLKDLIKQAQDSLDKFLGAQNADGSSNLNNAINVKNDKNVQTKQDAVNDKYKETLSKVNDSMIDTFSKTKTRTRTKSFLSPRHVMPSNQDIEALSTKLDNVLNAFLAQYKGDGKNIESEYTNFVNKIMQESDIITKSMEDNLIGSSEKYAELKDMINNTGSYVSSDEKEKITKESSEFIINELYQGKSDITLLKSIYPAYASDKNFIEAQKIINGITTSATPKEDMEKAQKLIESMMKNIGADKIIDGVKNQKLPPINFGAINKETLTSSISGYDNNESLSSGYGEQNEGRLNEIQNQAKQKLESLRSKLHAQLKSQMGADYDKAEVDKYVDDAIYQTITEFSNNLQRTHKSDDSTNIAGFEFCRRSGTKKGRYAVNIQQLVNTFLTKLEAITVKASEPKEPSKNPVDRVDVMGKTSLADEYQDNKIRRYGSVESAKLQIKSQLETVANELKKQLKKELGSKYNSAQIEQLISQAMYNSVNSMDKKSIFIWNYCEVNTAKVVNKFFDEFDKLYAQANGGNA